MFMFEDGDWDRDSHEDRILETGLETEVKISMAKYVICNMQYVILFTYPPRLACRHVWPGPQHPSCPQPVTGPASWRSPSSRTRKSCGIDGPQYLFFPPEPWLYH